MERDYIAFSISVLSLLLLTFYVPQVEGQTQRLVSALYVFGDSAIDPGNNNVLPTLIRANSPPYGRDFPNGRPTGRFTNGRLVTDQLSELLGLPDLLPASLDPEVRGRKLLTGASFGSSASGFADSTSIPLSVLPLERQVKNFRRYKARLARLFGHEIANMTVSQALFTISSGTDDFCNNYYINPLTRGMYTIEQFQDLLLKSLSEFIRSVSREGATKLAVVSVPPFGCLPSQISLHNITGNNCVEEFNEVASSFNVKMKALVENMKPNFPGMIAYIDTHDKLFDIVKSPSEYGFEEARRGCCGTGLLETAILCNPSSIICPDPSKYVFWDSFHPTTECYKFLANVSFQQIRDSILSGTPGNSFKDDLSRTYTILQ